MLTLVHGFEVSVVCSLGEVELHSNRITLDSRDSGTLGAWGVGGSYVACLCAEGAECWAQSHIQGSVGAPCGSLQTGPRCG